LLQQNEVKYIEEIEAMKAQERQRAATNIVNRNASGGRKKTRAEEIAEADGIE
jgi:hypothetical protein